MHTKQSLIRDLEQMGLDPKGTVLAHFSYKSLGEVEGGPQTVIDAMVTYMKDGLMVFPTHYMEHGEQGSTLLQCQ